MEAADEVVSGVSGAIANGQMTGDLAIAMDIDTLSCSDYAAAVIQHM